MRDTREELSQETGDPIFSAEREITDRRGCRYVNVFPKDKRLGIDALEIVGFDKDQKVDVEIYPDRVVVRQSDEQAEQPDP